MHVKTLELNSGLSLSFVGPPLEKGSLPCVFYFALSSSDSLSLDPFNQPVVELVKESELRVFSLTLPGHEPPLQKELAIEYWAQNVRNNKDLLSPFFESTCQAIHWLVEKGYTSFDSTALMGLSRGGFVAAHVAARMPQIQKIIAFAPVTKIEVAKEFQSLKDHPIVQGLSLEKHMDELCKKQIIFYIGNHDTRVGTRHCFELIERLAKLKNERRERSGSFKLYIQDSIGYLGHGTPLEVFKAGAIATKSLLL